MNTEQTVNGIEIRRPSEKKLDAQGYKYLIDRFLPGSNPAERMNAFMRTRLEDVADLLDLLNQKLQGSEETLLSPSTMKMKDGESLVRVEDRYDLFESIISKLHNAPKDINPARVGDVLALAVVLLHPFHDGNGRTARAIGYVFQGDYDVDLEDDFEYYMQSREKARANGETYLPKGYLPYMKDGAKADNAPDVAAYFDELIFGAERTPLYQGTYGEAVRTVPTDAYTPNL